MKNIALWALVVTCLSAPAIAQTTEQTSPNPVGGVPNPVTPMGVDPATQQSRPAVRPFGVDPSTENSTCESDSPDDADDASTATPETFDETGTRQNPVGVPHQVHSGPFGTTTEDPNAD